MISGNECLRLLVASGFDFFTGVPCSLAKSLIATLEERGGYIAETREDAAVGWVIKLMYDHRVGAATIVDAEHHPVGIFSERDALMRLGANVPALADIHTTLAVLKHLGARVSRSSVAWWPDNGATSSTRGSLRRFAPLPSSARRKCTSLQNGLSSSVTASTATVFPSTVALSMFQAGFS